MTTRKWISIFMLLLLFQPIPSALAEGASVEVTNGWLNLRALPSEESEVLGKLKDGTRLEVDTTQDVSFAAVLSGDNVLGWVKKNYLLLDSQVAYEKHFDYHTYRVLMDYEATDLPTKEGVVILILKAGDIVEGRISTPNHIHLKGGGFVLKTALEEIQE